MIRVAGRPDWVGPWRERVGGPPPQAAGSRRHHETLSRGGPGWPRHQSGRNDLARHGGGVPTGCGCWHLWPGGGRGAGGGRVVGGCPPSGAWCRNLTSRARLGPETTKRRLDGRRFVKSLGGDLLSHPASRAVPSALEGLTSGFGMGPGVSPPLWPPKRSGASGTPETSRTTQRARATRK